MIYGQSNEDRFFESKLLAYLEPEELEEEDWDEEEDTATDTKETT